ncbi:hypothetical protein KSP40_PGU015586 [Platanthera guangdongensis]|uniref:ethanolamine kinase n=1 Tax=Platanthera guangdongensis TaxID=2320717 RepID=A0ABR2LRS9_9ASPA
MRTEGKSLKLATVVKDAANNGGGGEMGGGNARDVISSIPSSSISIDTSLPVPEMKPRIMDLCKDLFRKWSNLDNSYFSVERVSGGITNLLLKVTVKEASSDDVFLTVRLYGPNTDLVIDRKRELQALPYISAAGFGAELLGLFENGMIQSFIKARTLSPSDMSDPKISAEIASQLRKFHQVEVVGSKEPQLWNDISKFLEQAEVLEFDEEEKHAKYKVISFKEIHKEVNALKENKPGEKSGRRSCGENKAAVGTLGRSRRTSLQWPVADTITRQLRTSNFPLTELQDLAGHLDAPVVFAHNDLLSGNLMRNDEEEKLYLIDFEYGSYSYRGYDIANHFNEYAGYDCDYNLYPGKEAQYHFLRNYLHPDSPHEVDDKDVEALYIETNTFRLASHLYWAVWSLIQARVSPIDFDYLGYFFLRYEEYKKQKEACISLAKEYISGGSNKGSNC